MAGNAKSPLLLGGCGCLSVLIGLGMLGTAYYSLKQDATTFLSSITTATSTSSSSTSSASSTSSSSSSSSPAEVQHYANSREGRTGNLAESYVDFSFDYPKSWTLKPKDPDAVNFVAVTHVVDDRTYENLNVGYFKTSGSTAGNETLYPQLVEELRKQFAEQFPGLTKLHERPTKVGSYDGYEGLFTSTAGSGSDKVDVYTRVILLPTPDGSKGVTLLMLGTSANPDLHEADDLAKKGELPGVLESFRFGG